MESIKEPYNYSGYRQSSCPVGAENSAHKRGMAIDIKISNYSSQKVQELIQKDYKDYFQQLGVTGMELNTDGWTHVACENFNQEDLVLIPYFSKETSRKQRETKLQS